MPDDFQDRFFFSLTDSQSTMTIIRSQRLDSGTYELTVSPDDVNLDPIRDKVKISVKCKWKLFLSDFHSETCCFINRWWLGDLVRAYS